MMKPGLRRGQLVKWKDDRGFGFIQPLDGSPEVFLHISELKDATRRPSIGDTIYYHLGPDKNNKVQACNAFILGARNKPALSSSSKSISHAENKYPFPIWKLLLLSILPLVGSIHFAWKTTNPIPLILYPLMSLLTFGLYADDKSRAQRGKRRTPEKTLHLFELAGGWVGGFIAQKILHHKSVKTSYQIEFWLIVILHMAFWVDWLFLGGALVKGLIFLLSNLRK